ncbi:hypothetical protein SERLADRAFT_374898 [Serpula lacrymans var. lacrymans S7.9]|uniref:Uncharacterized protein n=1 Tax=Serpula lacrymans var. lacrymans (strain S7.9) TaxID=578457 RepID=F8PDM3_SERL9|nr:uncharacterized protein SERLADRAFT_374898 [Serpula lacrymans var. lacrymans S7.9]EGO18844.1 hypothetical protein SERLADRAFT_374898 [Serpula lacrymans var. lacrymans S7.9]
MTCELKTFCELFANHQLQPNHHLSLHLDKCLSLFSPIHSWWAFLFEHYNGIIHNLNSNQKPGEMEKSFLKYFCIGANLRAFASHIKFPQTELYDLMMKSFHQAFIEPNSSLLSNFLSYETTSIFSIADWMELSEDVVKLDGVSFSTPKSSLRNSFVLFKFLTVAGAITAGQTCQIFYITVFSPSDKDKDLFLAFENLGTQLYYNHFKFHPCILKLSDIVLHFSCLAYVPEDIGQECIIAKLLDRVDQLLFNDMPKRPLSWDYPIGR